MNPLVPVLICASSVVVATLLVYFFVFPRLPGFSLNKHKILGGIIFVPLQGITTAIGFGAALYMATIMSVITALGGGLAAVPIIFCVAIGGTAAIFFVANYLLIMLYKLLGIFEIASRKGTIIGVCSLMASQLVGCAVCIVCCIAMFAPDNRYAYIDTKGNIVIEKKFGNAGTFKDGKAKVTFADDSSAVEKYIDHKGKVVEAPSTPLPEIKYKMDDDPLLYESNDKWSIGPQKIVLNELELLPFSEGLAAARPLGGSKNWGFVDANYKFQIAPDKLVDVRHFTGGLAPACIEERVDGGKRKWGFIDKSGKFVIEPKYLSAQCFSDGLALVSIIDSKDENKTLYGYIDKQGKFVIEPKYKYASSFSEGLAAVAN